VGRGDLPLCCCEPIADYKKSNEIAQNFAFAHARDNNQKQIGF
jgi:hypothetical protein